MVALQIQRSRRQAVLVPDRLEMGLHLATVWRALLAAAAARAAAGPAHTMPAFLELALRARRMLAAQDLAALDSRTARLLARMAELVLPARLWTLRKPAAAQVRLQAQAGGRVRQVTLAVLAPAAD